MSEIGLKNVGSAAAQELRTGGAGVEPFSKGDPDLRVAVDLGKAVERLGRHRLLDPERLERLDRADVVARRVRGETSVQVEEDVDVVADRIADRCDDRDCVSESGCRELAPRVSERIELQRRVAVRDDGARLVGELRRSIGRSVPSVGVGAD